MRPGKAGQRELEVGEAKDVSGGVLDHGTYAEDGPGTWEALASTQPGCAESWCVVSDAADA